MKRLWLLLLRRGLVVFCSVTNTLVCCYHIIVGAMFSASLTFVAVLVCIWALGTIDREVERERNRQ